MTAGSASVTAADSLTLTGYGELVDVQNGTWPTNDTDTGAPAPDVTFLARILVDGEVGSGDRTSNRTIVLPICLVGTAADVIARRDRLVQAVNATQFSLTWTPPNLPAVMFDCYRGICSEQTLWLAGGQVRKVVTITCQALPFTRPVAALVVPSPTLGTLQLESFDAATGFTLGTGDTAASNTASKTEGTASLQVTSTVTGAVVGQGALDSNGNHVYPLPFSWQVGKTGLTGVDYTTRRIFGVRVTEPTYGDFTGFTQTIRLYSGAGTATWAEWLAYPVGSAKMASTYALIQADTRATPANSAGTFDITNVTGWRITLTFANAYGRPGTAYTAVALFDDLRAYPTVSGTLSGNSNLIRYDGIAGVARTPVSFTCVPAAGIRSLLLARSPAQPAGFAPILNDEQTSTTPTATDAAAFGGSARALTTTPLVYRRPAASFKGGSYILIGRLRWGTAEAVTVTAGITGDANYTQTMTASLQGTSTYYQFVALGEITLPPRPVAGQNTATTLDISITTGDSPTGGVTSASVLWDEGYLVSSDGDVLLVNLPSGVTTSRIWLDAPGPTAFSPQVYGGTASDRSDAISLAPWLVGQGGWNLEPGTNHVVAVFDTAAGGTLDVTYFPRYFAERAS